MLHILITNVGMMLSFVNNFASFFFTHRGALLFRLTIDDNSGKDKKRAQKSVTQSKSSLSDSPSSEVTPAALQEALEQVKREAIPEQPQEKEAYFMSHVSMGEQLSAQGTYRFLRAVEF